MTPIPDDETIEDKAYNYGYLHGKDQWREIDLAEAYKAGAQRMRSEMQAEIVSLKADLERKEVSLKAAVEALEYIGNGSAPNGALRSVLQRWDSSVDSATEALTKIRGDGK